MFFTEYWDEEIRVKDRNNSGYKIQTEESTKKWRLSEWIDEVLKNYISFDKITFYPYADTEDPPENIFNMFTKFRAKRLPPGKRPNKKYIEFIESYLL